MSRDGTEPVAMDAAGDRAIELDGADLLGTTIAGNYVLESVLGRGGMGLVFRAQHLGLRRQVAVKLLHPSLATSADVRSRFEREAFAAGRINHPNCINVMDSGKLPDGTRYLAMEYLDGRSLADILETEGQVVPGRALHILSHILRGLGHIHEAGLIHRDIKPENIFLIRQGSDEDFAKILDFGIAKGMGKLKSDLEEGVKLTQAGMAFGTPIYMAPEQALGNPMDGRSDLYAAAVMAYEMLCGQPPFYSEDKLEVMSMHTAKPVPAMRTRLIKGARPVPSSIERLILRGLTKKPAERYANAEVFLAAVEDALRTPDGGVTDVTFERPRTRNTGSQPLVTDDGRTAIGASGRAQSQDTIADAIEDALASQTAPQPTPPPATAAGPGGVGIGLPYTGPLGEPIFGLTPQQRLGQPRPPTNAPHLPGLPPIATPVADPSGSFTSTLEPETGLRRPLPVATRRRWIKPAAILGGALVFGVVIAIVTRPASSTADQPADDDPDAAIDPGSPAGRALTEHKLGRSDDALAILEQDEAVLAGDGEMQLVLGHIRSARFERRRAIEAYARALSKRPDLEASRELRANLRTAAADKDASVVANAFDLWVRTADPEAKKLLVLAAVSDDMARRHAVIPVVERHKLDKEVEWWRAYSLDLQQEEPCEKRREAVGKLRALGDPRAITALQQAVDRRARSNPRFKVNACLVDEARAAIGYLAKKQAP